MEYSELLIIFPELNYSLYLSVGALIIVCCAYLLSLFLKNSGCAKTFLTDLLGFTL